MAKGNLSDGIVVRREVDKDGFVYAYDRNDRICWGGKERERVVLVNDLRKYSAGLHIGQLGWTVPGTSDSYKWIDVIFDNGVQLPILVYGIARVDPEHAVAIASSLIANNRGTRFDADAIVSGRCYREWVKQEHAPWIDTDRTEELGEGPDEVYAFTFPSLEELARLKEVTYYPVKVGCTRNQDAGAVQRIRDQMTEAAAYPERAVLLSVCQTWNGQALESLIHTELKRRDRGLTTALGLEWFMTNQAEVVDLCRQFGAGLSRAPSKPLSGSSPELSDSIGVRIELGQQHVPRHEEEREPS